MTLAIPFLDASSTPIEHSKASFDQATHSASAVAPKVFRFTPTSMQSPAAARNKKFSSFMERRERNPERASGLAQARAVLAEALYSDEGETLKTMRLKVGLTQMQLAAALDTSQPHVARLESGRQEPNLSTLKRLTKVLNFSIEDVIAAIDRQTEINEKAQ